jgi:phage terminase small subunit
VTKRFHNPKSESMKKHLKKPASTKLPVKKQNPDGIVASDAGSSPKCMLYAKKKPCHASPLVAPSKEFCDVCEAISPDEKEKRTDKNQISETKVPIPKEKKLTPKEKMFVKEYLIDLNASQACLRAGYQTKNPDVYSNTLMVKVGIKAAIQNEIAKREKRLEINADYVLTTIRDTVERCRQAEPVMDKDGPTGEYKFDSMAVMKGCELLGRHLKLFTDKFEATGKDGADLFKRIEITFREAKSHFANDQDDPD